MGEFVQSIHFEGAELYGIEFSLYAKLPGTLFGWQMFWLPYDAPLLPVTLFGWLDGRSLLCLWHDNTWYLVWLVKSSPIQCPSLACYLVWLA